MLLIVEWWESGIGWRLYWATYIEPLSDDYRSPYQA